MNKIILSVVIFAGAVCLTNATCSFKGVATCSSAFQTAALADGMDKTKLCAAISTFIGCVKSAGCPISQIQTDIDNVEKQYGLKCGSSIAKVSVAVMLLALASSYLWK